MFEHGNCLVLGKSKYSYKAKEEKAIKGFCILGDRSEKMKNQIKQMMDVSRV